MSQTNRRDFLKVAASVLALNSLNHSLLGSAPSSSVRAWVTSRDKRYQTIDSLEWRSSASSSTTIRLDPSKRQQEILGFGAAFTDASCYLLNQRSAILSDFFGPSGLRLSVCRTCVGASDYSTTAYSFDDSPDPDPELKRFSIEHDRPYI